MFGVHSDKALSVASAPIALRGNLRCSSRAQVEWTRRVVVHQARIRIFD